MSLQLLNGPTILAGESLSGALDTTGGSLLGFTMPDDWTPANITFQISINGMAYNDLFDYHGNEIIVACRPGTAIIFPEGMTDGIGFIKFRSGTREFPVDQDSQRDFAVTIETKPKVESQRDFNKPK